MTKSASDIADELLKKAEKARPEKAKTKKTTTKSNKAKIDKNRSILEQALELPIPDKYPVLYEGNKSNCVTGEGSKSADLMFVGEAPGYEEDQDSRPFIGLSGQMLRKCLGESNIDAKDVWITNTVKQRPPQNRDPKQAEIMQHLPY